METCLICKKDVVTEAGRKGLLCPECVGSSNYFQGGPGKQKRTRRGVAEAVVKTKRKRRRRKSDLIDLSSDNQKLDITGNCHLIKEKLVDSANSKVRCYLLKLSEAIEGTSSTTSNRQGRSQRKAAAVVRMIIS